MEAIGCRIKTTIEGARLSREPFVEHILPRNLKNQVAFTKVG
jgi:hypothetical protein